MYHGDLDGDGRREIIETEREDSLIYPRRNLATLNSAMPWLSEHLLNYDHYAQFTVEEFSAGARLTKAIRSEITTLQSMVFLRTDGGFEPIPLPVEAQLTAAFCPVVADFDNDGTEDIALSQNVFGVHQEESRQDAGFGLLLLGQGDGTFETTTIGVSGLTVFGEGRAAAAADFNHDGRTDLVICQNGSKPKLFLTQVNRRGLRVQLQGSNGNREAVGAQIRLELEGKPGPSRTVRLGSGFLSQNSTTQVLGAAENATALLVAWPSGKEERYKLAPNQSEITAGSGQGEPLVN